MAAHGTSDADRRVLGTSVLFALALHGLALFGLRLELGAAPPPRQETAVVVALVAPSVSVPAVPPPQAAPRPIMEPPRERPRRRPPPPRPEAAPVRAEPALAPAPSESADVAAVAQPSARAVAASVRGVVSARPRYKTNPEPIYPAVARRRRQQGTVLLSVRVDAAGRPGGIEVRLSSGFPVLDEAAVAAVRDWDFEPGRADGEPVASQVEVPIRFELDR
jgi:protein TonB